MREFRFCSITMAGSLWKACPSKADGRRHASAANLQPQYTANPEATPKPDYHGAGHKSPRNDAWPSHHPPAGSLKASARRLRGFLGRSRTLWGRRSPLDLGGGGDPTSRRRQRAGGAPKMAASAAAAMASASALFEAAEKPSVLGATTTRHNGGRDCHASYRALGEQLRSVVGVLQVLEPARVGRKILSTQARGRPGKE